MVRQKKRVLAVAVAMAVWCAVGGVSLAQPAAGPTSEHTTADLWENLIHFIRIGQAPAAKSFGQALLSSGAQPAEIYMLSVGTPGSLATLVRGRGLEGMEDVTRQLLAVIEKGYQSERSNPEQIRKSIELLGGTQEAYKRGRDRLIVSGEYAVPQLLRAIEDTDTTTAVREKILVVLPQLGKAGVLPLVAALATDNVQSRQFIAHALDRIEYPHAIPGLTAMLNRKGLQAQTTRMVRSALVSCAGGDLQVLDKPVAQLHYDLAQKFYYRAESLIPDLRTKTANVWYWDKSLAGLTYKPVPREIFCDVYAMRYARLALKFDPKYYPAVSLWLAANLKRQIDLPDGAADPTRTPEEPTAEFYVLASGAKYQQHVLARALADRDWPVAVAAIEALGATSGADSLVQPVIGGAQPLVQALSSPNRVVRYWAGISLATALPKNQFTGYELVMPILASAMRQTGQKTALVVVADQDQRNALKDAVRSLNYAVVDADDPAKALAAARAAGGVDVAILATNPDPMVGTGLIRRDPLLATLPIVIISETERFRALAKADSRIRLVSATATAEQVKQAVGEAVRASAGIPLSAAEATQWAVRSADAVRKLGLTRTTVYRIVRCRPALVAALKDPRPEVQVAAAGALATMPGPEAQRPIADLALDSSADVQIRVAAFASLGESVRRFGNALTDRQAQGVVDIVSKGSGEVRIAAATILGALSLPSEKIKDLIVQD